MPKKSKFPILRHLLPINDIELFKAADRSYAVANAVPELKAIATDVIESNNNDGVARFIRQELKKIK